MALEQMSKAQTLVSLLWLQPMSVYRLLYKAVLREVGEYLSDPVVLVEVAERGVRTYDFTKEQWTGTIILTEGIFRDSSLRYVLVDMRKLMGCGGVETPHTECFTLNRLGTVELLSGMLEARRFHGLILWNQSAYVFGGFIKQNNDKIHLKSSEKLQLLGVSQWKEVPSMPFGRSTFNPCQWNCSIWLCGGGTPSIDVFSPYSETYQSILTLQDCAATFSFVRGEELVVFARTTHVSIRKTVGSWQINTAKHPFVEPQALTLPVLWQDQVYLVQTGRLLAINAYDGRRDLAWP